MQVSEIKDLCLHKPLCDKLEELIGEPMSMHLNLMGWISTERNWHQDDYLNPPGVDGWYVTVWMALDDIHPNAGPFEYVPGSHKWDLVRRNKVLKYLTPEEAKKNSWPKTSERFLTRLFEEQVASKGVESKKFIAVKGDVLIWHSRLMHRGSNPVDKDLTRKTIITHYCGINHRSDMPFFKHHNQSGYYFVLD
jgi:ectoine hydroxylase-related dioxygenase (phytanoyl-CoA dioxygenase family)